MLSPEQIAELRCNLYNALSSTLTEVFTDLEFHQHMQDRLAADLADIIVRDLSAILRAYEQYWSKKHLED